MKNTGVVLLGLSFVLLTGCNQGTPRTGAGDVPDGGVTIDGALEVSPADLPDGGGTDLPVPKDTTDTVDTVDAVDTVDVCVPDCGGKVCGDDGCGGTCGTCDDGNPCTEDACVSGACENPLKALEDLIVEDCLCGADEDCAPLEDDDLCNGTLACDLEAEPPTCRVAEDSVVLCALTGAEAPECNAPTCLPETGGCVAVPVNDDGPCDDGDACTSNEHCVAGACTDGAAVGCDDGNPCTDDGCAPSSGCLHTNNASPCDDADPCTHTDICAEGACAGTGYACDAPAQCETAAGATCDGDGTCTYPTAPLDGTPCDDDDVCTVGEACAGGACAGGDAVDCGDGNPCTTDGCSPLSGCLYGYDDAAPCDDDDPCTTGDHCAGGGCASTGVLDCDDGEPCTSDACEPGAGGCVHGCAAAFPGDPCCAAPGCDGATSCLGNPVIDEISEPGQGLGEIIVIAGSGFGADQEDGFVRLCGLKVTDVIFWSDGTIVLTLPPGTHSGPVVVVDPWGFESNPYPYVVDYNKTNTDPFRVWDPAVFSVKDVGYYTVGTGIEMEPGWVYLYTPTMLTTWDVSGLPTPVSAVALPSQAHDLELVGPHLFVSGSFGLEIYRTADLQAGGFSSIAPPVCAAYSGVKAGSSAHAVVDGQVTAGGVPLQGTLVALLEWTMSAAGSSRVYFFLWDAEHETLEALGTPMDPDLLADRIVYAGVIWPHTTAPKLVLGECIGVLGGTCNLHEYDISDLDALSADPSAAYLGGVPLLANALSVPRDMKPYGDRIWMGPYGGNVAAPYQAGFHAYDLSPDGPPVHATWIDACSTLLTAGTVPDEMQPCTQDADCPEGTGLCTNGWCVDRRTCDTDADCPGNQGNDPPMDQECEAGWCQTLCAVDADCTKENTSSLCTVPLDQEKPRPCRCIDGHCQVCRSDHLGSLDVIPEAGLVVGSVGQSQDLPEKHNLFLFDADAGPDEHMPLSSAETANWTMDIAGIPGRFAAADEWAGAQLFDYETAPAVGITGFAEPAWADPLNRIFSPGWAIHVRQHPVIHGGRVYWGQGGIVGAAVDALGDPTQWINQNQQHASPYTRTAGDGSGDALLFKGFIENFITGMKPAHYQLYRVNPASGALTLLNDPLADACPSMGEVLWWDEHVVLSAESVDGLAALYVDPDVTDGAPCAADADCEAIGDQCPASACVDGTCRCAVVERRALIQPLESLMNNLSDLIFGVTTESWVDLERVDGDTVAAGQGWTFFDPMLNATLHPFPPEDWGGLFFFDVGYPDGAPPSPAAPALGISLTPASPPALNCTLGHRIWTLDSMEIDGETWLLGVAGEDYYTGLIFKQEHYNHYVFLVRVADIPTLNADCLAPEEEGYNPISCANQLTGMSIVQPAMGQFDPPFSKDWKDTHLAAAFWMYDGVPHVAVANRLGAGLPEEDDHTGVWVFNVDDPDISGFDLGRIHEPNVYFQPTTFGASIDAPGHFTGHPDMNTRLIPEGAAIERLDDGDLLVFGTACTIARMGTP